MRPNLPPELKQNRTGCVLAIGNFDGVHKGHQAILAEATALAGAADLELEVITFEPHPRSVLTPKEAPLRLTEPQQKIQLLQQFGAGRVHLLTFNQALASQAPGMFVKTELLPLNPKHVVVGEGFRFGHKAAGNVAMLKALGAEHGFEVTALPPVRDDLGEAISSSRIRAALAASDVKLAEKLLGHKLRI